MEISYSNEFYKNILDSIADGIYFLDKDRMITYWNKGAERITGYMSEEVIGMHCHDNILVHINENGEPLCGTDLCPAYKTIATGQTSKADKIYLHHKDGSRVPVSVRIYPSHDEDGKITGAVEIFRENFSRIEIEQEVERLKNLALVDELTGVGNRRYGEIQLDACFNQLKRYNWSFGVLLLDIDNFKSVNDNYGHDTGDRILRMVAQTMLTNIRSFDKIVRWGGEEFLVVFLNIDEAEFKRSTERLMSLVSKAFLAVGECQINVTACIGATLCKHDDTHQTLIKRADDLMYQSKHSGPNKITIG